MGVNSEFPQSIKGYEILERLAAGGFGVVYRVKQSSTFGREVAMKVILPKYANQPEFIRRFEAEAEIIARLEHPHIVPLYDYWRDPSGAYLVMRYLKGGNVKDVLEKDGAYELEAASQLLNQVASALEFAHRNNVVHRDIKPGNILLDEDGIAYVADFGIAKDLVKKDGVDTAPESIVGSLDYISPEQARSEPVSGRTDIYSLGVTLYEMLTGEHPFKGFSTIEKLYKHINDPLPDITTLDDEVCDSINAVIHKATSKNPAERYADVLELAHAFREAANLDATEPALSIIERLTMKEHEFLQHLVDGLTVREIAATMFISEAGVKFHRKNAYKKLGVKTRVQAIIKARELDLIYSDTTLDAPSFAPSADSSIYLPEPINPYKGLQAFQMSDAQDFFGREKFLERLLNKMQEGHDFQRFLAIVGPSGSGKSSLVKAGLLPALLQGKLNDNDKWYVVDMQPNDHPLDRIEVALQRVANEQAENIPQHLSRDERGLVRIADLILPSDETELLIYIDQFEEVFTLCQDEDERQHFLNLLYTAVTAPRSRVRVIVTLRADYYDKPLHYHQFGEMLRNRIETILPLSAKELERAIVGPAERVHLQFETGLVAQIVSEMTYQAAALPLLQYALTELFNQRQERLLTHEAYQAIGGAVGALANRAEELYQELDSEGRALCKQLFLRLVTLGEGAEDTRRRATFNELISISENKTDAIHHVPTNQQKAVGTANGMSETGVRASELMEEIIDAFADYRLLTLDHDDQTRQPTVEVAHEAILREWERLRHWLNDSRDDIREERILAQKADEWLQFGHETGTLLREGQLTRFQEWRDETNMSLTPLESEFIEASIKQREIEEQKESERIAQEDFMKQREIDLIRRALVLTRGLVAIFVLAAILSGGFGFFANNQRIRAEDSEHEALRQASIGLAALARKELEGVSPERGVLLALEALENYPYTSQAESALANAVEVYRPVRILHAESDAADLPSISVSPEGDRVAGGGDTMEIWDMDGNSLHYWDIYEIDCNPLIQSITWSPDGENLAVSANYFASVADTCPIPEPHIIDANTGEIVLSLVGHKAPVNSIDWSPDGSTLMTASDDGTIRLWNASTGAEIKVLDEHLATVNDAQWSPDGLYIASVSSDAIVRLWDATTGEKLHTLEGHIGDVTVVAWSPDSRLFATGGVDEIVRLWDATTGDLIRIFNNPSGEIFGIAWSSDAQRIAASTWQQITTVWDVETGGELLHFSAQYSQLVWSPDNTELIFGFFAERTIHGLHAYDIRQLNPMLIGHTQNQVFEATWSPYGTRILTYGMDETARIWDAETGIELLRIQHPARIWYSDWSPDGTRIATACSDSNFRVWDSTTGDLLLLIPVPVSHIAVSISWSPDGTMLAANTNVVETGAEVPAFIWDAETGEQLQRLVYGTDCQLYRPFWSPDSKRLVTPCVDSMHPDRETPALVWDVSSGEVLAELLIPNNHSAPATSYSPDGTRIAASYWDGTIRIWDAETYEVLLTFGGHSTLTFDISWSPDGSRIVTGDYEGRVIVWNPETGEEALSFVVPSTVWSTDWSPDGKFISAAGDNPVPVIRRVWQSTDELIDYVYECCVTRELTDVERQQFGLPER